MIDGCEDNDRIKERDRQTRTLILIFIIMGLFFGAVLSMKFGYSTHTARQLLLKRIVEAQERTNSQTDSNETLNQRTLNLINNRETAWLKDLTIYQNLSNVFKFQPIYCLSFIDILFFTHFFFLSKEIVININWQNIFTFRAKYFLKMLRNHLSFN